MSATTVLEQFPSVRHRKVADEIADVLQQMILDFRLTPGDKITQEELAKVLNVSTMPVREALLKLAAFGLVDAEKSKSFKVKEITEQDTRDSYWTLGVFVGELTRRACINRGPELAHELREGLAIYTAAARVKDYAEVERGFLTIDRAISLAADSPRLLVIHRANLRFIATRWYPPIDGWIPLSESSHKKIITAVRKGDADRAGEIACTHMRKAGELLITHLKAEGRWG